MIALYLGAAAAILLVILILVVKRWGRAEAQEKTAHAAIIQARRSHEIDEAVARLDVHTLDRRLHESQQ